MLLNVLITVAFLGFTASASREADTRELNTFELQTIRELMNAGEHLVDRLQSDANQWQSLRGTHGKKGFSAIVEKYYQIRNATTNFVEREFVDGVVLDVFRNFRRLIVIAQPYLSSSDAHLAQDLVDVIPSEEEDDSLESDSVIRMIRILQEMLDVSHEHGRAYVSALDQVAIIVENAKKYHSAESQAEPEKRTSGESSSSQSAENPSTTATN